jgi:hypothetical protein
MHAGLTPVGMNPARIVLEEWIEKKPAFNNLREIS